MPKSFLVERTLTTALAKALKQYPVLSITGPRQSGKTTLCQSIGHSFQYLNMEIPENRNFALEDPNGFLTKYQGGVILDEVQTVPELFPYLQYYTDKRKRNGEYILSGSQNFLLLEKIVQSLAGRIAIFSLLPFGLTEIWNHLKENQKVWQKLCLRGFYPRLYLDKKMNPALFYSSYLKSYIERDLRTILNIHNLRAFQQFIKLCAFRTGSIFNSSDLSKIIGVDHKTIQKWASVLEASYIIYMLPSYFENYDKRILKKPKIYFYDTGLLCHLLGIRTEKSLSQSTMCGHVFENFIVSEIHKNHYHHGHNVQAYYWQDSNRREVDLVIDENGYTKLFEIKMNHTIKTEFFQNLNLLKKLATTKSQKTKTHLIYTGDESYKREGHQIMSWKDFGS